MEKETEEFIEFRKSGMYFKSDLQTSADLLAARSMFEALAKKMNILDLMNEISVPAQETKTRRSAKEKKAMHEKSIEKIAKNREHIRTKYENQRRVQAGELSYSDLIIKEVESGNERATTIAEKTGIPRSTVDTYLCNLAKEGKIKRAGYGVYGKAEA